MDNLVQMFKNDELDISFNGLMFCGEPVFIPSEIGKILEYKDLPNTLSQSPGYIEDIDYQIITGNKLKELKEIGRTGKSPFVISPRQNSFTILTVSGLNAVIIKSTKPKAVELRIWITQKVIPSIQKHGVYATNNFIKKSIADPDWATKMITTLKEERAALKTERIAKEEAIRTKAWISTKREKTAMITD